MNTKLLFLATSLLCLTLKAESYLPYPTSSTYYYTQPTAPVLPPAPLCSYKVKKAGFTPTTNGCTGVPDVDLNLVSLFSFSSACNNHDLCYQNCAMTQAQCDSKFFTDMKKECEASWLAAGSPWWNPILVSGYYRCQSTAYAYYQGVSAMGATYYADAQDAACEIIQAPCMSPPVGATLIP